ncbi:MAG: 4Fe-4S binding protein [Clostridia bacterium]|jgi:NAD-dependent dihydropyrimidine dehydrogenase PreA subunit|nr:4Fe-4S binding protein [Clostridia bacterium]
MNTRKIIEINEELCNGCGICVNACHESAIQMINGKAKLVHDKYCDGLGDCLPACPTNAIQMIERKAYAYDQDAVDERVKELKKPKTEFKGCPGSMARNMGIKKGDSELKSWPVQMKLINPRADFLEGANLLIAADCTAFAYSDFHNKFIKGKVALIGCPKLDQADYEEKILEILMNNNVASISVVKMQVPCCSGIAHSVKNAIERSGKLVPYIETTISVEGNIV